MGRKKKTDKLMSFDAESYIYDLRMELKKAVKDIRDELWNQIMKNINSLPFKSNKVRLAGGAITSDAQRKHALIDSVIKERLKWEEDKLLTTAISAMSVNFQESHIGWYYEYGIGEEAETPKVPIAGLGTKNEFRPCKEIVSRSKHIAYLKDGRKGIWKDMGGNLRITGSPKAGVRNAGFIKYVGDDVKAYHWFRGAFELVLPIAKKRFREAMNKVKPINYFYLRNSFILGRD